MSLGSVTFNFSALTTANAQLIRADADSFVATYTNQMELDFNGVTTSPTTFTINNVIGASPVALLLYNPNAAACTVLGIASFTQSLPAGQILFMPAFVTTSNLTLTLASGTGTIYALLLK